MIVCFKISGMALSIGVETMLRGVHMHTHTLTHTHIPPPHTHTHTHTYTYTHESPPHMVLLCMHMYDFVESNVEYLFL